MKFSVVTISFNQVSFVEQAIRSVLNQRGVEVEYIIVDPGSSDGSRDIIERYRDQFASVIFDQDSGPAHGLNNGFEYATGDVFCYLNSDDTFEPDAFQRAAQFLDKHPELDVICGHAWVTDRHHFRIRRAWSETYRRVPVAYGAAIQIQPSTFIRREAFLSAGGFNLENRSSWDSELLLDLFLSGSRIGVIDEFLSTYRLHASSITNSGLLLAQIEQFSEIRFRRLMGRPRRASDIYIGALLRLVKHARFPLAAWERIMRGPVFNRGID